MFTFVLYVTRHSGFSFWQRSAVMTVTLVNRIRNYNTITGIGQDSCRNCKIMFLNVFSVWKWFVEMSNFLWKIQKRSTILHVERRNITSRVQGKNIMYRKPRGEKNGEYKRFGWSVADFWIVFGDSTIFEDNWFFSQRAKTRFAG